MWLTWLGMPKVSKITSLQHLFSNISRNQSFLQAGSIVFTGYSQACSKYPKLHVCNIFAVSQEKREG